MALLKAGAEHTLVTDMRAILLHDYGRESADVVLSAGTKLTISENAGPVAGHSQNIEYYGVIANGQRYRVEVTALDAKLAPKGSDGLGR